MARLFINEAAGPHADSGNTVKAMGWMRRVIANRLAHPSPFGSEASGGIIGVISAKKLGLQFAGFGDYPTLSAGVAKNIADKLAIADNPKDPRHPRYLAFVQAAIDAANNPAPADPCPTGLYFWRTAGKGGPGGRATHYQDLDGNAFFTLPADFFTGSAAPRRRRH